MKTPLSRAASLLAVVWLGCAPEAPVLDGGPDPTGDAGADAGRCPSGLSEVADGGCEVRVTYAEGAALPAEGRDHHSTWVFATDAGAFLAVASGLANGHSGLLDVWTAHLDASGLPENWRQSPSLSASAAGAALVTVGPRVYLVGGIRGSSLTSAVVSAPLLDDGTVGAWRTEGTSLNGAARYHLVGFAHGEQVCTLGGFNGRDLFDDVQCAPVGADGALGPFVQVGTLPTPRSHHSVVTVGQTVYVTAGFNLDGAVKDVVAATWQADGGLSPFTTVAALPAQRRTGSATFLDGAIWMLNGEDGDGYRLGDAVNDVWRLEVLPDAGLGPVQVVSPANPIGRRHTHQAPAYGGRLYSVCGTDQGNAALSSSIVITPQ